MHRMVKRMPILLRDLEAYAHLTNVYFTALCFSHVEVRFDISVIKELIDCLDCCSFFSLVTLCCSVFFLLLCLGLQ